MIDNNYLSGLPSDDVLAANQICSDFSRGVLKDDAEDIAFVLEALMEGKLPEGWDASLDDVGGTALGRMVSGPKAPSPLMRIRLLHKYIKALSLKIAITHPSRFDPLKIELPSTEAAHLDDALARARTMARHGLSIDAGTKRDVLTIVNRMQSEADRKTVDYSVFLDCLIDISRMSGTIGSSLSPLYPVMEQAFRVVDNARRRKEGISLDKKPKELAPPPQQLPAD
jgi:hypothetical protein